MRGLRFIALLVATTALAGIAPGGAAAGCASPDHAGGEWRTYGHDLEMTRNQTLEKTISRENVGELAPAWVFSVAAAEGVGTIESTPMIAFGCLYVATQAGEVYAMNADTGDLLWRQDFEAPVTTLAPTEDKIFAAVSIASAPEIVALDRADGSIKWRTTISTMDGSEAAGSPVVFNGMVASGVSCAPAEGRSGPARHTCRGAFVLLRQSDGELLTTDYAIPDEEFAEGLSGGGIWGTPSVDLETGYAYVGSGNPFSARQHPRTNALLKIDVDPARATFGDIVDSFAGTPEQYAPAIGAYKPACELSDSSFAACEEPDLDMAQAALIYRDRFGRKLVHVGQGSGVAHTVRADTMELVWQALIGPPYSSARAGGSTYDGERIFQVGGMPAAVWALDKNIGDIRWYTPSGAGTNTHNPLAYANGLVYSVGGTVRPQHLVGLPSGAVLNAFDGETGETLLSRPVALDIQDMSQGSVAGGVAIARNTVYFPVNGVAGGGYIVAYRLPA